MDEMMVKIEALQEEAERVACMAAEALYNTYSVPKCEELLRIRWALLHAMRELQDASDALAGGALIYGAAVGRVS